MRTIENVRSNLLENFIGFLNKVSNYFIFFYEIVYGLLNFLSCLLRNLFILISLMKNDYT